MPVRVLFHDITDDGDPGLLRAGMKSRANPLGDQVVVAGVGYSQVGRSTGRSEGSLAVEASKAALADAGLSVADLDGIAMWPDRVGSVFEGPVARLHVPGPRAVRRALLPGHGRRAGPVRLGQSGRCTPSWPGRPPSSSASAPTSARSSASTWPAAETPGVASGGDGPAGALRRPGRRPALRPLGPAPRLRVRHHRRAPGGGGAHLPGPRPAQPPGRLVRPSPHHGRVPGLRRGGSARCGSWTATCPSTGRWPSS